jgi:hypothetical protein
LIVGIIEHRTEWFGEQEASNLRELNPNGPVRAEQNQTISRFPLPSFARPLLGIFHGPPQSDFNIFHHKYPVCTITDIAPPLGDNRD